MSVLANSVISNEESFFHTSFGPLLNAQPRPYSYFQLATGMEAIVPCDSGTSNDSYPETALPFLEITVEPTDRFRFRYKSESGSHGKLRGVAKSRAKTNFPTVKLHNNDSSSKIEIKASLYTNEQNPRPHVLELVGKNCSGGTCSEILSEDNTAIFRYLEIESKKKDELLTILSQNIRDNYSEDYNEEEIKRAALNEYKALNTNAARLCFEAFQNGKPVCEKVLSRPITNLKSASDLKIIRISLVAGRCSGGEDMILLCNKINKDDIKIRFYEKDENETVLWEDYGEFNKPDVHHQVAIPFKTPKYYRNTDYEKTVYIELYRPSDNQSGEAITFIYIPDEIGALRFSKKRKFAPTESAIQNLDIVQASSSSQFASSPSNLSSGTEEEYFQGNPSASSCNEQTSDPSFAEDMPLPFDIFRFIQNNDFKWDDSVLVDLDNCGQLLENCPGMETIQSTKDEQVSIFEGEDYLNSSCQMDSATEFQASLSDCDMGDPKVILTSKTSSFVECLSELGNSVFSYMQNSLSSYTGGIKGATGVVVCESINNNRTAQTVAEGQMLPISSIEYQKNAFPRPYGNMGYSVKTDNQTRGEKNLGESSKNFEQFKKGISDILNNQKKDTFLHYIANLMSVEDENGNLLLHLAVLEQSENINLIAKILDIAPHNVNKQNKFKETCLHFATMKDSWKILLHLMLHKGNPSIKNQDGNNCFHLAAKSNHVKSMKLLLLPSLKHGKRIPSLDDLNYDGLSPLHLSIMNNAKECMQLLLQAGADVNIAERKTGSSPLHLAIDQHPSLVGPLLSHPAIDTDCTDFRGYTAYEAVCKARGNAINEVCEELLKVAQLSKGNEGPIIISFLQTENMKMQELDAESDVSENSSSETSDSESEDDPNVTIADINHQHIVKNIQCQNTNCITENLNNLDEKLCKILDANSGWRKLGIFIGFDESTLNGLEILSEGSSPTKIILKKVKKLCGCDGKTFINILQKAELEEIAHLLENLNL